MKKLTLDNFIYISDIELSQYTILNNLQKYRQDFNQNRLYPSLTELTELNLSLKDLDRNESNLAELHNRDFYKSCIEPNITMVKTLELTPAYTDKVFELIEWAKPLVKDTIDEGKILYDFVKKNILIEQLGENSCAKKNGYILIPDNKEAILQILKYEIANNTNTIPRRQLNTQYVHSIRKSLLDDSPETTLMNLFSQYNDMPKSANYICNTDLDFPFEETILPVAKRKLISRMAA